MDAESLQPQQYTQGTVKIMGKNIQKKNKDTQSHLKYLRNAFADSCQNIDAFLEVDNALYALVGYLTGSNTTLQLEAVWCLTNISANENQNIETFVKATSAYLITFLKSGSVILQDQSAWALGNMAADSHSIREILKAQSIVKPLSELIESNVEEVIQSSLFALCNLCKSLQSFVPLIMTPKLIKTVFRLLNCEDTSIFIVGDSAWLFTYFSWNHSGCVCLLQHDVIKVLMQWVKKLPFTSQEFIFLVLPVLRVLGNIIGTQDGGEIFKLKTDLLHEIIQMTNVILLRFQSNENVIKECLWTISNLFSLPFDDFLSNGLGAKDVEQTIYNILPHLRGFSHQNIKNESAICVCNLLNQPLGKAFKNILASEDVATNFVNMLNTENVDLIWLSLTYFDCLLSVDNNELEILQKTNGFSYLDALQYHFNENIRAKAFQIIQKLAILEPS